MATTLGLGGLLIVPECLGTEMILHGVRGYFGYVDGQKSGVVEGYKYTVVLPSRNFAQLDIKIIGNKLLDVVAGEHYPVKFDNLEIKMYYDKDKKLQLTARATGVHRLENKR